ncbi:MAG: T9SS type A sorting domain-containing protein, partial [Burkholderiales bacterium]|nr:T9SS type A sorting domain-containing protein [Flavobacterium sp.]
IQAIIIYDVSGKRIVTYIPKEKSRTFTDSFDFAKGVYFAKITLESGLIFTKKIRN